MIRFVNDYRDFNVTGPRLHRAGALADPEQAGWSDDIVAHLLDVGAVEIVGVEDDIVELDSTPLHEDFPAREALIDAGFDSVEDVNSATDDEITAINGIGNGKLASIRAAIEAL